MTAAEIDALGRRCPAPVIELARHIGDVPIGAVIVVLSDDAAAAVDIPAWCRMRAQDYLGAEPSDRGAGATAYAVRRSR